MVPRLRTKRIFVPLEKDECRWFYYWTQTQAKLKGLVIHHPNEGKRSPWIGKLLKLMGLQPGLPDYQLLIANSHYAGLWIEMKRRDKRLHKRKPEQDAWIAKLLKIGHYACYAYGWHEASTIVDDYLANRI